MKALMKTTKSAKPAEVEKKWHLIDADGLVVGRARDDRREHPARQAQAELHAARRLRRPCRHDQCRQGPLHRPQARAEDLLQAHRLSGGLKEITAGKVLEGRFPERVLEKAVERMIPRGPLGRDQMRALHLYNGTEHPHGGQDPRTARRRVDEPQEQGGRIMADKKSLSDLGELTNPSPRLRRSRRLRPKPAAEASAPAAPPAREGREGREKPADDHGARPRARRSRRCCASSSSTSMAALMRPAAARTPSRASGSSPARARSSSTAASRKSISPARRCA